MTAWEEETEDFETELEEELEGLLTEEITPVESALTPEAQEIAAALRVTHREAAKPDISRLPDAIVGGSLVVRRGEKIVIERRATFLAGNPYLDTRTYTVREVKENGDLVLWDDSTDQWAMDNWINGPGRGHVYKIALRGGMSSKRRRGRPRKHTVDPTPIPHTGAGCALKKGRGRPKGSKNRSREEVKAEKAKRNAARAEKRAKRLARKGV